MANYEVGNYFYQEKKERFVTHRMVVKIGGSTIMEDEGIDVDFINDIARQASVLFHAGVKIVVVCSGAVDTGNLLIRRSGKENQSKKRAALFGQSELTARWIRAFEEFGDGVMAGVHLISEDELENAKELLSDEVMDLGVLVINGYDAVNDDREEARRDMITADNDKLAGFVSKVTGADTSVFLTNVDGVLDQNGNIIPFVDRLEDIEDVIAEKEIGTGRTGGMKSKCESAHLVARFSENKRSTIANGRSQNVLLRIARGENCNSSRF